MKKLIVLSLAAAAAAASGAAFAQPSIGLSIGINQPGVYGRVNIGPLPLPALVAPQPVLVAPPPMAVQRAPIYLYVAPYEQLNWGRYCSRYRACGQPVYFVREDWVRERYGREHPEWNRGHERREEWRDDRRDHRERGDRRDDRRDHRD